MNGRQWRHLDGEAVAAPPNDTEAARPDEVPLAARHRNAERRAAREDI